MASKSKYFTLVGGVALAIAGIFTTLPSFLANNYLFGMIGIVLIIAGVFLVAFAFGD